MNEKWFTALEIFCEHILCILWLMTHRISYFSYPPLISCLNQYTEDLWSYSNCNHRHIYYRRVLFILRKPRCDFRTYFLLTKFFNAIRYKIVRFTSLFKNENNYMEVWNNDVWLLSLDNWNEEYKMLILECSKVD